MKSSANITKVIVSFFLIIALWVTNCTQARQQGQVQVTGNVANQQARKRALPRWQARRVNRARRPAKAVAQQQPVQMPARQQVQAIAKPAIAPIKADRIITYGLSTHQNKRPYQEDRFSHAYLDNGEFFAVYDGHGGDKTSTYLQKNMHIDFAKCVKARLGLKYQENVQRDFQCAFVISEEYALANFDDGSTAVVAFIDKNDMLHLAWVGDSRAIVEKNGAVGLTTDDHKPDVPAEKKRIEKAGGTIVHYGVWRVNGLAVSRSIGDKSCKQEGEGQIIAVPAYKQMKLNLDNHFMIVASDGLWDVMNNNDAIDFVKEELQQTNDLNTIAQRLQGEAIKRGSQDNITVCVVKFNWPEVKNIAPEAKKPSKGYATRFWNWWGKK